MADRSGQTTHEFTTNRLLEILTYIFAVGVIVGAILVALGVYTQIYQELLAALRDFLFVNWWVTPFAAGFLYFTLWLRKKTGPKKGDKNEPKN